MKKILLLNAFLLLFTTAVVCQINIQPLFNEIGYSQVSRGFDPEFDGKVYAVTHRSTLDSIYTMKLLYKDSAATQLLAKQFYKKGVPEGPFFYYEGGALSVKGTYKDGKLHGERQTYRDGKLVQEARFQEGRKRGVWKEFTEHGQLRRTLTYDNQENLLSVQVAVPNGPVSSQSNQ